jgi:uncharacterized membrane protein
VESKAKILGHPIHPILIPFPLGLLSTSVVFDVVHLLTGNGKWSEVSFWMIAAGVIGGLVAAVFGLIDWLAIPSGTRAKAVGLWPRLMSWQEARRTCPTESLRRRCLGAGGQHDLW